MVVPGNGCIIITPSTTRRDVAGANQHLDAVTRLCVDVAASGLQFTQSKNAPPQTITMPNSNPVPRSSSRSPSRVMWLFGLSLIPALFVVGSLTAHDFWLVPNAFAIAPGSTIEVLGQTSSKFPTTESAVAIDRIVDARIIGAQADWRISDLSIADKSLRLRARPTTAGQYAVVASLHWRSMRESAESFRRYLNLEGAPAALERIDRDGLLAGRDSVTRRYAKYAKTLVQVGTGGGPVFSRLAGHPLEFVPSTDPSTLRVGDTLRVRLILLGQPAAKARVHAGAVEWSNPLPVAPNETASDMELHSDSDGVIRIPISASGLWNVRTIQITQSPAGSGADWDAHWATLVFFVGGTQGARPLPGSWLMR